VVTLGVQMVEIPRTKKKLAEASFFLRKMRDSQEALSVNSDEFGFYISAFVSAGRSVTFVLQAEQKSLYDAWFGGWEQALSAEEQALLEFMRERRNTELKEGDSAVHAEVQFVPFFEIKSKDRGSPYYGIQWVVAPGEPPPTVGKVTHYYQIGGTREEAIETCRRYEELLERLVNDFLRDHAASG